MADSFASFESFKNEVAQRTRRALMEQQQQAVVGLPRDFAVKPSGTPRGQDAKRGTPRGERASENASYTPRSSGGRPKSALASLSSRSIGEEHVSVSERIPERHRPQKEQRGNNSSINKSAAAGNTSVSKRLLQLAPTKQRTVNIYPNDGQYHKAAPVHMVLPENMELLLNTAMKRLNLATAAWTVYRAVDGSLISNLDEIKDEECIVVAGKESFKPQVDTSRKPRPAPAVQYTRALRCKIESTLHSTPNLLAGSPSAQVKFLLQDPSRLLRRFRLSYNTSLQKDHMIHVETPRTLENVKILCGLGAVSLRNQSLASLKGMMLQSDMVELYLQNNMLSDLDHMIVQPRLKELRLENNFLISLRGFVTQPKLESVWLEPNPICLHPHHRLMVAILQNNNYLVRIDDVLIEREDRLLARALAPYVADALRAGWLLDTEVAVDADYDMTVEEFQMFQSRGALSEDDMSGAGGGVGGGAGGGEHDTIVASPHGGGGGGERGGDGEWPSMLSASGMMAVMPQSPATGGSRLQTSIEVEYGLGGDGMGEGEGGEGATEEERMRSQIARLTDALVRATQKAKLKDSLLAETQSKLRDAKENAVKVDENREEQQASLEDAERMLAKRSEQCRQLYEIVGALEARLADSSDATEGDARKHQDKQTCAQACVQTDDWVQGEEGGDAGESLQEQLASERRARGAERAALENRIQRLELSAKAFEASSHQGHLSLFSDVRARLASELSYSIPDAKVLVSIIQDIDSHLSEFGGNE